MATIIHTVKLAADTQKAIADITKYEDKISAVAQTVAKHERTLSGEKMLLGANNWTAVVAKLGGATGDLISKEHLLAGASKMTAAEKARLNSTLQQAIEKYTALGKTAPTAMLELEEATRKAQAPTQGLSTKMVALGVAIGTMAAHAAMAIGKALVGGIVDLVKRSGEVATVSRSFEALTKAAGETGNVFVSKVATATKGLVTNLDIMAASNKALLLGLPVTSDSMADLAKTAMTLGGAMKQDATKSLDDLITALGRSSPMILDNLGLTVKLGEANEKYAKTLGKSAEDLTDAEKKMAFYNAALEAARKKMGDLGEHQLTLADRVTVVKNQFTNLTDALAVAVARSPVVNAAFGAISDAIATAFGSSQTDLVQTLISVINKIVIAAVDTGRFLVEFGKTATTVFYAAQLPARALGLAMIWIAEQSAKGMAAMLDLAAAVPGMGAGFKGAAEAARGTADRMAQVRDVAEQNTKAAWDGVRGQSAIHQALDKVGAVLFNVKVRLEEASHKMVDAGAIAGDLAKRHGDVAQSASDIEKAIKDLETKGYAPLGKQEQDWIRRLDTLHKSAADIAKITGVSELAVQQFQDALKAASKTAKEADTDFKKSADKIREIEDASLHVPPAVEQMGIKIDFARDKTIEFMNAMDETSISLRGAEKAISEGLWSWESLKRLQNENARATESFGTVLESVLGTVANIFNNIEGKGTQMAVVVVRAFQEMVKAAEALKNATSDAQRAMAGASGLAGTLIAFYQIAVMASGGASKMRAELDKSRRAFIDAAGGADELIKRLIALGQPDLVSRILYAPNLEAFNRAVDDFNKVVERWEKRVQGLESAAGGLKKLVDAFKEMGKVGVEQFDRIGLYAAVVFAQILRETGSLSRAFEAVKPAIETLLDAIGDGGSAATRQIIDLYKTIEKNKPAVQAIEALTQIMAGLEAAGVRSQELFNAFGLDLVSIFKKLTGDGVDAKMALVLMQPALQKLWELQDKFGFSVDEGTQALIDQGKEFGLIGPNMRDINEQILEVLKAIKDILASVTAGWQQAAAAVDRYGDAVGNIPTGPQPGDPGWQFHTGGPVYHTGGKVLAFQRKVLRAHTGLAVDEVPAILQTGEFVLSRRDVSRIGMATIQAMRGGARPNRAAMGATTSAGSTVVNNFSVTLPGNVFLQTPQDKARLAREVGDAIMQEMRMRGRIGAVA